MDHAGSNPRGFGNGSLPVPEAADQRRVVLRAGFAAGYLRWVRDLCRMALLSASVREQGAVLIVLFHGLFQSREEAENGVCDPQQGITLAFFAEFVESLLAHGIAIRGLEDAVRHPRPGISVVMTFDDGYFSNVYALKVLEHFAVPATFFISTRHVLEQKSFWWDAAYREGRKRGTAAARIRKQVQELKSLTTEEIEARIVGWYGPRALTPVSDCDRPFSPAELADFARSRYVSLGNHTHNHGILVNYEARSMRAQIDEAQGFLSSLTGIAPRCIAYPNGQYSRKVLEVVRAAGLEIGLTIRPGINQILTQSLLELRRLTIWGTPSAMHQARVLGSLVLPGSFRPRGDSAEAQQRSTHK
jgi:peptidoglycan/xylan/chitin deacetylase (PgdA/CDA1 family)